MRHLVRKHKLNRPAQHRRAMVRNLLTSLFDNGKVATTDARAKALVAATESFLTLLRRQKDMFNKIREAKRVLFSETAQRAAIALIADNTATSGIVKTVKLGYRAGDTALMVQVQIANNAVDKGINTNTTNSLNDENNA